MEHWTSEKTRQRWWQCLPQSQGKSSRQVLRWRPFGIYLGLHNDISDQQYYYGITMPRKRKRAATDPGSDSRGWGERRRQTEADAGRSQRQRRRRVVPELVPEYRISRIMGRCNVPALAAVERETHADVICISGHQHYRQRRNRLHLVARPPQNVKARSSRCTDGGHGSDAGRVRG